MPFHYTGWQTTTQISKYILITIKISSHLFSVCLILIFLPLASLNALIYVCCKCKILNFWFHSIWCLLCPSIIKEQTQGKCLATYRKPPPAGAFWETGILAFQTKKAKSAVTEINTRTLADLHGVRALLEWWCSNAVLEPTVRPHLKGEWQTQKSRAFSYPYRLQMSSIIQNHEFPSMMPGLG